MNEEEELLEAGRPTLSRPARIAGAVLIVAALVAVFAVRLWPTSDPKGHQAALGSAPPAPTESVAPSSVPPTPRGWPTATSACGGETEVSIVSSRPPGRTHRAAPAARRRPNFAPSISTRAPSRRCPANGAFVATLSRDHAGLRDDDEVRRQRAGPGSSAVGRGPAPCNIVGDLRPDAVHPGRRRPGLDRDRAEHRSALHPATGQRPAGAPAGEHLPGRDRERHGGREPSSRTGPAMGRHRPNCS